jgi:hypothetical protein
MEGNHTVTGSRDPQSFQELSPDVRKLMERRTDPRSRGGVLMDGRELRELVRARPGGDPVAAAGWRGGVRSGAGGGALIAVHRLMIGAVLFANEDTMGEAGERIRRENPIRPGGPLHDRLTKGERHAQWRA